jgi:putative endonuclease
MSTVLPPSSSDPRQRLGLGGERSAIRYLADRGWELLAHRFRVGHEELDLIVRRGSLVAFVEVKTRRGSGFGSGREAIGWRKRRALGRVAEVWRLRNGAADASYRFDVVEVVQEGGRERICHIEDAWRP